MLRVTTALDFIVYSLYSTQYNNLVNRRVLFKVSRIANNSIPDTNTKPTPLRLRHVLQEC